MNELFRKHPKIWLDEQDLNFRVIPESTLIRFVYRNERSISILSLSLRSIPFMSILSRVQEYLILKLLLSNYRIS